MNTSLLFKNNPIFETSRLVLRKLEVQDATEYFDILSDPETIRHTRWGLSQEVKDTITYLEYLEQKYQLKQAYHWGVVDKESQKLIGRVAFISFDKENDRTEIGYVISRLYWNKGLITEAAKELIDYGFNELEVNRIEAKCNEDNLGSERVMQKIGMKLEGILREQLKMNGKYHNQKMYSLIKSDCKQIDEDSSFR